MAYMASTTMCAMQVPTLHAQASNDKVIAIAPLVLPSLRQLKHVSFFWSSSWQWMYLVYGVLAWQTAYILYTFWWKAPVSNIDRVLREGS
jgi:hypothetical protein